MDEAENALPQVMQPCSGKGDCKAGRGQQQQQGQGQQQTRSHPLLLRLGLGALPDMRLAQSDVQKLQLHESFARLKQENMASELKASEWR